MKIKYLPIFAMLVLAIFSIVYTRSRYEIPILLYHHFLEDGENKNYINKSTMRPEEFETQISYLKSEGYESITTDELYDFLTDNKLGRKKMEGKKVLITFDDGYLSNYTYAYGILKKHGMTGTVFPIVSLINEAPAEFDPNSLTMFSYKDMEAASDVFEFGSHTYAMHSQDEDGVPFLLCKKPEEVYSDFEVSFSKPYIKKILAYPFGAYKESSVQSLKKLEVKTAYAVSDNYVNRFTNPYKLPRFTIHRDLPLEDFKKILSNCKND